MEPLTPNTKGNFKQSLLLARLTCVFTLETSLSHFLLPNSSCPAFNKKIEGTPKSKKKVWRDKGSIRLKYERVLDLSDREFNTL